MLRTLWWRATRHLAAQSGQGMVEYGLIIGLVAVALITILTSMNGGLAGVFQKVTTTLNSAS